MVITTIFSQMTGRSHQKTLPSNPGFDFFSHEFHPITLHSSVNASMNGKGCSNCMTNHLTVWQTDRWIVRLDDNFWVLILSICKVLGLQISFYRVHTRHSIPSDRKQSSVTLQREKPWGPYALLFTSVSNCFCNGKKTSKKKQQQPPLPSTCRKTSHFYVPSNNSGAFIETHTRVRARTHTNWTLLWKPIFCTVYILNNADFSVIHHGIEPLLHACGI